MPAAESSIFLPAEHQAGLIAILLGETPVGDIAEFLALAVESGELDPIAFALQDAPSLALQELAHQRGLLWLNGVGCALDAAKVRFVVLKGIPLGERYYNPPYLLPYVDLDFLIDPDDFLAAHSAIAALGY